MYLFKSNFTIPSFLHSWLITGYTTRVTRRLRDFSLEFCNCSDRVVFFVFRLIITRNRNIDCIQTDGDSDKGTILNFDDLSWVSSRSCILHHVGKF